MSRNISDINLLFSLRVIDDDEDDSTTSSTTTTTLTTISSITVCCLLTLAFLFDACYKYSLAFRI